MEFDDFNVEITDIGINQRTYGLRWHHEYGGTVACMPSSDGERVYFGCDNNVFYCLDANSGKEIWRCETGGCNGNTTSVIHEGRVYFGSYDGYLYCCNKFNGSVIWKFKTGNRVVSGVAIKEGRIVFGSYDSNLYCLDMGGKELWRYKTGDDILSTPVIIDDKVLIGSYDCNVYCINLNTGHELWRFRTGGSVSNLTPINTDGKFVYIGSWDFNVYCIEIQTGKQKWRTRLGGGMLQGGTTSDGMLYIGVRKNDTFYAIDKETGEIKWTFKTPVNMHASNVTVWSGMIYFGGGADDYSDGYIYCLSREGKLLWYFRPDGPSWVGPVIINGKLFATSWNCRVYRIDPESGKEIWSFRTSGEPSNEYVTDCNQFEVENIVAKEEMEAPNQKKPLYQPTPELHVTESEYITKSLYSSETSKYTKKSSYR